MIQKYVLILIYVYSVLAISSFIENNTRAEFFELTDNEIAVFKVTLPTSEFEEMKDKADYHKDHKKYNFPDIIEKFTEQLNSFITAVKEINFKELYPGYDYNQMIPQFNINEDGYANLNSTSIIDGFQLTEESLNQEDFSNIEMYDYLLQRNQRFNINYIFIIMETMTGPNPGKCQETYYNLKVIFNSGIVTYEIDTDFKTKNALMSVELNGEKKDFKKITISFGGRSSRMYGKPCFNIKIRGNKDLFGRTQFKIRSGARDATFLRQKLACDIHNRLGLTSISANYITLYINDVYMGLYVIMDAIKPSWIGYVFGEENTKSLYQCDRFSNASDFTHISAYGCVNEDDEVSDTTEYKEFLAALDKVKTINDLKKIFDVESFLQEIAIEFLFGSFDHFLNSGNNLYLYKMKNGIWKLLYYDFDAEFGQDLQKWTFGYVDPSFESRNYLHKDFYRVRDDREFNEDYTTYSFGEWADPGLLIKLLIYDDPTHFEEVLKNVVNKVFNPALLFPHIDELKQFISPYIKLEKTPDANGKYPGKIDELAQMYSLTQWDSNCEFTTILTIEKRKAYGLKYWILQKYRYICNHLDMECDPIYMDPNYQYFINSEVEFNDNNRKKY